MDIELFIEEIKKFHELYDKKNKYYMDSKRKQKIWGNLDEIFSIDAKKKWNYLRDKYVREKRLLSQASGSKAKVLPIWEFYPMMEFLNDTLAPRKMIENLDFTMETSSDDESFHNVTLVEEDEDVVLADEDDSSSPSSGKKSRKSKDDVLHNEFRATLKQLQHKLKVPSSSFSSPLESDEDGFFLQSIGCSMKKMSNEEKTQFKIQMLMKAQDAVTNSIMY